MILYFSATGNSKYVAERLAEATQSEAVSIIGCDTFEFTDDAVGIVTPTYVCGLPSVVREFLQKAKFTTDYLYLVATYGMTSGGTNHFAEKYSGRKYDASYSVRMPDTWTPGFDLSTPEKVAAFTKTTESDIDFVIENAKKSVSGKQMRRSIPLNASVLFYPVYEAVRKTKHLTVSDACIGCGLCARKCPVNAIEMEDKHPVWTKEKCAMCLGCLHRCPKFAIQYGKSTAKHGQYTNPHVKV